ncbi:MAG TPA: amidohydrolase [Steroidobacteraceae bacterium]|nr:amidohydrolase [Steroidobacteraceae bacterium]
MSFSLRVLTAAVALFSANSSFTADAQPSGAHPSVAHPAADLIVRNARIWTVNPQQPQADALAVLDGRFVAVGTEAQVSQWQGPRTRIVDAKGNRLVPGFNDAHVHFSEGGAQLSSVQLTDATSLKEFVQRVADYASHAAKGEWIRNGNWDESKWSPAKLPTRQDIDTVTRDNPAVLSRYDGHAVLANSKALAAAGITSKTPDPPGGVIVRDASGEPTGVLKDAAEALLESAVPPLDFAQRRRFIERAMLEAASRGVTSVQHMSMDYGDLAVYSRLLEDNKLTVRIYGAPSITRVEDQARLGIGRAFGGPSLRIGALKMLSDGSLGSRTAYFIEPYADDAQNHGLLFSDMLPLVKAGERLMRADAANLQVCTHAIGDAAVKTVLDLYQAVETKDGPRDRRWRIEHAQHLSTADFDRFAKLHVIASVQPYHAIDDGRWAESRIGHERATRMHAYRTFLDHGVRLAFGTDFPVAPIDPMLTLYAAVTRATLDGKNSDGWFPGQKLSIEESIAIYTLGSAYAEFQENEKGSIEPGKLADMVLLSRDVLKIAPAAIRDTHVLKTWLGGLEIYDAETRRNN